MKIFPIEKWPRSIRLTIGPFVYIFIYIPIILTVIIYEALCAAWEEIKDSEGWNVIKTGFYTIFK